LSHAKETYGGGIRRSPADFVFIVKARQAGGGSALVQCSFGWWLVAHAYLLVLMAGDVNLLREKNIVGWWLISETRIDRIFLLATPTRLRLL
jgi:hypothetical protein